MAEHPEARLRVLPTELACVKALLGQHMPGALAWAYGSRVADWPGQRPLKPHSDLDLAIVPPPGGASALAWAQLREALTESDLPWRVDVTALDDLPPSLRAWVQARGVALGEPSSL